MGNNIQHRHRPLRASWTSTIVQSIKMADLKDWKTAPFDARFPNQNQTKSCFANFLDYQKCVKVKGEEFVPCQYFYKTYKSLCPIAWVDKWNDQIEEGTFPA